MQVLGKKGVRRRAYGIRKCSELTSSSKANSEGGEHRAQRRVQTWIFAERITRVINAWQLLIIILWLLVVSQYVPCNPTEELFFCRKK
jgi:hypothetical protein